MGCCVVAFSKYLDTRSMIHCFAASFIYLLIQVALNYPPLGCLFPNVVVDAQEGGYSSESKSFAIVQVVVMVIFAIVYIVVIYRKRIAEEEEIEEDEEDQA